MKEVLREQSHDAARPLLSALDALAAAESVLTEFFNEWEKSPRLDRLDSSQLILVRRSRDTVLNVRQSLQKLADACARTNNGGCPL